MSGWLNRQIQDVAIGIYDGPHATPAPSDDGPVFLGIGNVTEDGHLDLTDVRHIAEVEFPAWTKRVVPRSGDIVFTYEATLNRYAIIPEGFRGCLGRRMALIRPDPAQVDTRFLFYSFFGREWRATIEANRLSGATVDRIPLKKFPQFPIRLPDLESQRRIAFILGAYDDLIHVNQRRVALLEEMAGGLFEEWFVRLRFPGHEGVALIDTPEGALPPGWRYDFLGSLLKLNYGKALKADERQIGAIAVIGSSGVVGEHNATLVNGPGIVVGRKGNVGSVIWSEGDFWPIDTTYYVETATPLTFAYELLRRVPFQNTDAAVPGLNRDYALSRRVVVPPAEIIEMFGRVAGPLRAQIVLFTKANRTLAAARDLLLPRLISGQLSVDAAERELEEAA